jgi:hypothetical protein
MKLDAHLDLTPWNEGKVEIRHYLEQVNKEKKVSRELSLPGAMNCVNNA